MGLLDSRLLDSLIGDRIYLDANIWIYAVAEIPDLLKNKTFLSKKLNIAAITSADGSSAVPISRSILIRAAAIRASTKLKLPDAIHAATAITTGCTTFLTNDKQFKTVKRLHTLLLSQVMTDSDEE